MAVTGTETVRSLVTSALRKIGVVAMDRDPTAAEIQIGLEQLDRMLKAWQNKRYNLWTVASQTLTLTTAASYDLNPVRPLRIYSARFNNGSIEIPMVPLTRQEYDDLPVKTTTGTPTQFYYDKQREAAKFYVWPVLASASGQTVEITYEREIEDQTDLDAVPDVPGEWYDAVVYNLGVRLMDDFEIEASTQSQRVMMMAKETLDDALGSDVEESVFFAGDYAD